MQLVACSVSPSRRLPLDCDNHPPRCSLFLFSKRRRFQLAYRQLHGKRASVSSARAHVRFVHVSMLNQFASEGRIIKHLVWSSSILTQCRRYLARTFHCRVAVAIADSMPSQPALEAGASHSTEYNIRKEDRVALAALEMQVVSALCSGPREVVIVEVEAKARQDRARQGELQVPPGLLSSGAPTSVPSLTEYLGSYPLPSFAGQGPQNSVSQALLERAYLVG